MVEKIEVENFKSLQKFEIEPGRFNVLIGANGSGKTNILEAIAMGAAAAANKLDYEFLGNRLRVTSPEFMRSAFGNSERQNNITFKFFNNDNVYPYVLRNSDKDNRSWIDIHRRVFSQDFIPIINRIIKGDVNILNGSNVEINDESLESILIRDWLTNIRNIEGIRNNENLLKEKFIQSFLSSSDISSFLIYTPEYSFLKKFEEFGQITPLGLKGEGLFYTLKKLFFDSERKEQIETIKEYLSLFDWFDDLRIPLGLMTMENRISIQDRFIDPALEQFDQRSTNEGFLFFLFYLVLFTSKDTPAFFAIDNLETGFNPKLCTEITRVLASLSKQFNKQVIVTTHNPAILDGLDLKDDEQRLFVVSRNDEGHTRVNRISTKPGNGMKLSEVWSRGYIGGMPDNF